eukprot:SAG11_NODE_2221_length_3669_cov_7.764986_2_plen_52_part_00
MQRGAACVTPSILMLDYKTGLGWLRLLRLLRLSEGLIADGAFARQVRRSLK